VLQYHGTLTVGRDVHEAYLRLETVEHTAKIIALSRLLGGGPPLPPDQVAKLLDTRQAWGFGRPDDAQEFCLACGVCHAQGDHRPRLEAAKAWDDAAVSDEERLVREIAERVRRELEAGGHAPPRRGPAGRCRPTARRRRAGRRGWRASAASGSGPGGGPSPAAGDRPLSGPRTLSSSLLRFRAAVSPPRPACRPSRRRSSRYLRDHRWRRVCPSP